MTTEQRAVSQNSDVKAVRGRPFQPGQVANPNGRPKKGNALRDHVRAIATKDKREIVKVALYEIIQNHDVQWATWLLKAEGESGETGGVLREMIVREYAFDPEALD